MSKVGGEKSSFATCYVELCKQHRLRPLPTICITMPYSLDLTTDRVRMDDWAPILNSLSLDRTLRSISVRSKCQSCKLLEQANSETKARAVGKAPVVLTRSLIEWLSHSLAQCVRNSASLTSLELEGIPVPPDCLAVLSLGLAATKSLRHLSLQRCCIGDSGCELICRTIANLRSIRSLDLSQCDLSSAAGPALASALSRQELTLYQEAWKQSLRYREPKFDSIPGLRRLTLNGNSKLGNEAILGIIEAVKDSLWLKALDLQQCGLTDDIAGEVLELLEHNKSLVIVDVRLNSKVREETLSEIAKRLERNNLESNKCEYRWLSLPKRRESKRATSATNLQKQKKAELPSKSTLARAKSAIIGEARRPPAFLVYRQPLVPEAQLAKRMKMKPALPLFERKPRQPIKPALPLPPAVAAAPKLSLHLDLQSQLESLAETRRKECTIVSEDNSTAGKKEVAIEEEKVQELANKEEAIERKKMQEATQQLLELREDRERLLEQVRRNESIVAEERARREFAEAKLRSSEATLSELQRMNVRREEECRGYLLVSQKSMREICLSFGRLLQMLENSARKVNSVEEASVEEENLAREDIKRRFALIMRKTKSENLKRGYFVDDAAVRSRLQMTNRYGKSEGNIRMTLEPSEPVVRLETHIGDTSDTLALPRRLSNFNENLATGKGDENSPTARARAIFANIIHGNSGLHFNT